MCHTPHLKNHRTSINRLSPTSSAQSFTNLPAIPHWTTFSLTNSHITIQTAIFNIVTLLPKTQTPQQCSLNQMATSAPCECKACLLERHPQLNGLLCTSLLLHKNGGRVCCCGKVHVIPTFLCKIPRKKAPFITPKTNTSTTQPTKRTASPQKIEQPTPKKKFSVKNYSHLLQSFKD